MTTCDRRSRSGPLLIEGFFVASNGLEQVTERRRDQVDDGRERGDVAIAAGTRTGGVEHAVEAIQASFAVRKFQRSRIRWLCVSMVASALRTGLRRSVTWRRKLVILHRAA